MYVCRTLSYLGATFDVKDCPLSPTMEQQYKAAAMLWTQLRSEFLYALGVSGKAEGANPTEGEEKPEDGRSKRSRQARTLGSRIWRAFWSAHQRFFRHMCMAAKVRSARIHRNLHALASSIIAKLMCPLAGRLSSSAPSPRSSCDIDADRLASRVVCALCQEILQELEARQARTLGSRIWRAFWSAHQRLFWHICMAAKVTSARIHCNLHVLASWSSIMVQQM